VSCWLKRPRSRCLGTRPWRTSSILAMKTPPSKCTKYVSRWPSNDKRHMFDRWGSFANVVYFVFHRWSSIPEVTSQTSVTNSPPTGTWYLRHSGQRRTTDSRCERKRITAGANTVRPFTKRRGNCSEAVRTHNNKSKEKTGLKMIRVKQIDCWEWEAVVPFLSPATRIASVSLANGLFYVFIHFSLHRWRRQHGSPNNRRCHGCGSGGLSGCHHYDGIVLKEVRGFCFYLIVASLDLKLLTK